MPNPLAQQEFLWSDQNGRATPLGDLTYALFVPGSLRASVGRKGKPLVLGGIPLATLEGDGNFRSELASIAKREGQALNIQVECSSFPLAARAVAKGNVAAILPSIAATDLVEAGAQEVNVPFLKHFQREMCLASSARLIRIWPVLQKVATVLAQTFFADGRPRKTSEIFKSLGERFKLTEQDLSEVLPSGTQSRWHNRANWALYDLYRAGLLDRPKKGLYVISDAGRIVVAEKPPRIDREYLMRFPQFVDFIKKSTRGATKSEDDASPMPATSPSFETVTPEEQMASLAMTMRHNLAADLLEQVRVMDPFRFERLVLDLLLAMGYGGSREEAAVAGKGVNDGGIDGLINEDRLGLDRLYVQAKRWQNTVGRPEIQNFVGALAGQHAHKGIFITTSEFSTGALEYVRNLPQRVILIDGPRLAELMIKHNIGVSRSYAYEIKRIDSDYFEES